MRLITLECDNGQGEVTFNADNIVSIAKFNSLHIILFTNAHNHYFPTHIVDPIGGSKSPIDYAALVRILRGLE